MRGDRGGTKDVKVVDAEKKGAPRKRVEVVGSTKNQNRVKGGGGIREGGVLRVINRGWVQKGWFGGKKKRKKYKKPLGQSEKGYQKLSRGQRSEPNKPPNQQIIINSI